MNYQALLLGASNSQDEKTCERRKARFLVDKNNSLFDLALANFESASSIIVALDPEDSEYFSDRSLKKHTRILSIPHPTQGALMTAGMCLDVLNSEDAIIVSAIDGLCLNHNDKFLASMKDMCADGGAIVFTSENPKYCYVRISEGTPIEFVEKRRVGTLASSGVYYFKNRSFLEDSIQWAVLNQAKVNNQFYFSSAINKLIFNDNKIGLYEVNENEYFRFSTDSEAMSSKLRLKGSQIG
jgi:hypothetical protein